MAVDSQGSWLTGLFLFNVIVATGTFALPAIFNDAGVVLSSVFLLVVVLITHTTAMYVMEAVTTVGLLNHLGLQARCGDTLSLSAAGEGTQIQWPTQISQVNTALLPTAWRIAWFFILIVYLYPDLAVYSVFISDTVQVVFPVIDFAPELFISGNGVYFTALLLSSIFLTPWVFGSFKGTTALQVTTTITRNVLLWGMIIIALCMVTGTNVGQLDATVQNQVNASAIDAVNASVHTPTATSHAAIAELHRQASSWPLQPPLAGETLDSFDGTAALQRAMAETNGKQAAHTPASSGHGHRGDLPWADFSKVPLLFGGIVYSTIHQQYAPSILAPLRNKPKNLLRTHRSVLCGVTLYYLALCLTAVAAFAKYAGVGDAAVAAAGGEETQCNALTPHPCQLQALYTFNFGFVRPAWFARFIAMAPLLSMLSNFPLIAMTLRDNLMILCAILLQHFANRGTDSSQRRRKSDRAPRGGYLRVSVSEPGASRAAAAGATDTAPAHAGSYTSSTHSTSVNIAGEGGLQSSTAAAERAPPPAALSAHRPEAVLVHPLDADAMPLVDGRRRDSVSSRLQLGSGAAVAEGAAVGTIATGARHERPSSDTSNRAQAPTTWAHWANHTAKLLSNPTDAPFEMRVGFALLSVVPAYVSAALTRDIDFLLRIVGCFGGSFIAFVMPCVLLQYAREAQQLQLPVLASSGSTDALGKLAVPEGRDGARRLATHPQLFSAPHGGRWFRGAILAFALIAFIVNMLSLFMAF